MLITIRGQEEVQAPGLPTFLAGAFRPFFLLGAIWCVIALGLWLLKYAGLVHFATRWPGWWWHGHEMVFGFAIAAIVGFILTAAPKWTKSPAPKGAGLGALVLAWLLARLAALASAWLPELVLALADQLVLVPLCGWAALRIYASKNQRNYAVPLMLAALAGADLLFHLQTMGVFVDARPLGLHAGVYGLVVVAALISGRIVPAFTESALRRRDASVTIDKRARLGALAVALAALSLILDLTLDEGWIVASTALLAALALLGRSLGWRLRRTLDQPIVWILHLGHAWLVLGFLLLGLARVSAWISPTTALHAFTAGALGSLILAVTSRASLGHSGRALEVSRATVLAYVLVTIGALLRVLAGVLAPSGSVVWHVGAGLTWGLAFAIFAVVYWPVLTRPRIDGRPG